MKRLSPDLRFAAWFVGAVLLTSWLYRLLEAAQVHGVLRLLFTVISLVCLYRILALRLEITREKERSTARDAREKLEDFIGYGVHLHGRWYDITKPCTTELKDAAADAVDAWARRGDAEERASGFYSGNPGPQTADRWWRQ